MGTGAIHQAALASIICALKQFYLDTYELVSRVRMFSSSVFLMIIGGSYEDHCHSAQCADGHISPW
jgi:hypothetical protein